MVPSSVDLVSLQNKADMSALDILDDGAFTPAEGGIWRYSFDDPAEGLSYVYRYRVSLPNGQQMTYQGILNAGNLPQSPWFTYGLFLKKYGFKNVKIASNKDSTQNPLAASTPDYELIQEAFDSAFEEVCDNLRGGVYQVPLDFTPNGGQVPGVIKKSAMAIAFDYLTDDRGIEEKANRFDTRLDRRLKAIYDTLFLIKNGLRQINAVPNTGMDAKPVVVHNWFRHPWLISGGWYYAFPDAAPIWIGATNGLCTP